MATDPRTMARLGRELVIAELRKRGFGVREVMSSVGPHTSLSAEAYDGGSMSLPGGAVRGRRPPLMAPRAPQSSCGTVCGSSWTSAMTSLFFVVPEAWMVQDIYVTHKRNLARHGGRRKHSPSSAHHAVRLASIEAWRDRWDLVENEVTAP